MAKRGRSGSSSASIVAVTASVILAVASLLLVAQGVLAYRAKEDRPTQAVPVTTTVIRSEVVDEIPSDFRVDPEASWTVSAEGVITRPGKQLGDTVVEGDVLAVQNERPIFVLRGAVPTFRSLGPGASGADVAQLQAALQRLGYSVGEIDGEYGRNTAKAVFSFYRDRDFVPVGISGVELAASEAALAAIPEQELSFAPSMPAMAVSTCGTPRTEATRVVCTLSSTEGQVVITPPESEASRVSLGQEVTLDFGGTELHGTIESRVEPSSTSGAAAGSDAATKSETGTTAPTSFVVAMQDTEALSVGDRGRGSIVVAASEPGSLTVASTAIREDENRQLWLLTPAGDRVEVELGLCVRGVCVVRSDALSAGQTVVLPTSPVENSVGAAS